jgi:dolichol-phosphate mannosyltransferase
MTRVLVVVPSYNEIENLESIVGRIRHALPEGDILIVDDSSPDGTGELADRIAADDDHVSVLHRPGKDGLGRAYLASFEIALAADYGFVVEIDADGSHDPAELPAMVAAARAGADLVIGSRWVDGGSVRNWPWLRQAISRTGNRYARIMLRSHIHDITAGFRVYRSELLRALHLGDVSSQGSCFQVEMAWRAESAGFRVAEHPIVFVERERGVSKMRTRIVVEALWRVTVWGLQARLRGRRPVALRSGA